MITRSMSSVSKMAELARLWRFRLPMDLISDEVGKKIKQVVLRHGESLYADCRRPRVFLPHLTR